MSEYGPALNGTGTVVEGWRPGSSVPDSNPVVPNSRIVVRVDQIGAVAEESAEWEGFTYVTIYLVPSGQLMALGTYDEWLNVLQA